MNLFDRWAKARPFIEKSVPELGGTHTIDDIALMIGNGSLYPWVSENAAVLTEFIQFPRMKVINCFIGGGVFADLLVLAETQIIPYAKQNGCSRIQGGGRRGWQRKLAGYAYGGIYMYKDI